MESRSIVNAADQSGDAVSVDLCIKERSFTIMKKKLFCMLAVMLMVLGLAACGGDKDGGSSDSGKSDFDTFMEVQKKMQDIKDMEFKMDMDMDMALSESEKTSTAITGTCKEVIKSKDDVQMEMKYTMNIPELEQKMDGTVYFKDGIVYTDIMGQKIKTDSTSELASTVQTVDTSEMLNITKEMVSDLQVKTEGSDTIYSFKIDPTKALDYFKNNASGYEDIAALGDNITFDRMNVVVTTDDKQMVKNIDLDCAMAAKVEGDESMNVAYKIAVEFVSINTDLKIDFPDFSDYQEVTV